MENYIIYVYLHFCYHCFTLFLMVGSLKFNSLADDNCHYSIFWFVTSMRLLPRYEGAVGGLELASFCSVNTI